LIYNKKQYKNRSYWTSNTQDEIARNSSPEPFISRLCLCWPSISLFNTLEVINSSPLSLSTASHLLWSPLPRGHGPEPVHETKNGCHDINPNGGSILSHRKSTSFSVIILRNIQEFERIIGNNSIDLFHDTPLHLLFVIDCPHKYGPSGCFDVTEELVAKGSNHAFLKHIEIYSRLF
jgi:hypothetical protein